MATQAETIAKYEGELQKIKATLVKYEELFKADGFIDTKEQKELAEMQTLIEKGTAKLNSLKANETDVDYDELVRRLRTLNSIDFLLKRWFLDGTIKEKYAEKKLVEVQYENAFVKNKVVKADATLFIKDYDSGLLKEKIKDKYSYDEAKALRKFFAENGGASHVDFLKENSEACIERYGLYAELEALQITGNEGITYYNNVLSPNRAALLTTDAEIKKVKEWKVILDTFITKYDALTDDVIRELLNTNYDNYVSILADMPNKLKLLEEAKVKAKKKDTYTTQLAGMSEEAQIESNPAIGDEDGRYIKKGKEPKLGKKNKVDKKNQNSLKKQGAYDKKTGEYDLYDQGAGDADEVDINDVKQGALGDCYLISAIAGVAKANPSYIKKLISYKEKETFATVKLYIRDKDGTRTAKSTKVDFYFPVSGVKAAFAKAGDGELWVMVLEKAYAKLMGGYDNIGKGGDPAEALAALTGNEVVVKEMNADDAILGTDLASVVVAGKSSVAGTKQKTEIPNTYTVTAVNPDRADGFKVALSGENKVFCSHAYTVTGVDATAKKVKLRNPHGGDNAKVEITFQEFRDCFNNFKVVDIPVE